MIYLYGLLDVPSLSEVALRTLNGQHTPLRSVSFGGWCLVYKEHDGSVVEPRRRNMLAHTLVVEHMMTFGTVLPARFGLVAPSIDAVAALTYEKRTLIAEEFEKLHGCVELGVRVSFPRDAALVSTLDSDPSLLSWRDRLRNKGAEAHFARADFGRALADVMDRRRGLAQKAMIAALRPHVEDYVLRSPDTDVEISRLEILVKASHEEKIIAKVDELARLCDFAPGAEPLVQIIGPAPCYHFVKLSLAVEKSSQAVA